MTDGFKKLGAKPGSVIYVGRETEHATSIRTLIFDAQEHREVELTEFDSLTKWLESGKAVWVQVEGVHDVKLIERLEQVLGIHTLVLEDIVNTNQRPKSEFLDNYAFFVGKAISRKNLADRLKIDHYCLLFGSGWVITFQEPGDSLFEPVKQRLVQTVPRKRFLSSDYLAYAVIDAVTDGYFHLLEGFGDQIEDLEETITMDVDSDVLPTIQRLKRQLLKIRKQAWPMREAILGFERSESEIVTNVTRPYLRDLYEHIIQIMDTVETYREQVGTLLDLYHTGVSNRMNEIMKVLTVFAAIFIPLSFLAGVYGMNFSTDAGPLNMPELGYKYGYITFWVIAGGIGLGLLWYFRRKRWI